MKIHIDITEVNYDTGIHSVITEVIFSRSVVGDFFNEDRFPNLLSLNCSFSRKSELKVNCSSLIKLICSYGNLTKLELNCSSLNELNCQCNRLTELKMNCPSLQKLWCHDNRLTELELNCPHLEVLSCGRNLLTNLEGLEFCAELKALCCCETLLESAKLLKIHLPRLELSYYSPKTYYCQN